MNQNQAALFLDRDGVVIDHIPYLNDFKQVRLINNIGKLILEAKNLNMKVIVVTNQSGIGSGTISWDQYHEINNEIQKQLFNLSVSIDDFFVSPYSEKEVTSWSRLGFEDRKPNPGMILKAQRKYQIDLSQSALVGDSATDIMAGFNAKIRNLYFLTSEPIINDLKKSRALYEIKKIEEFKKINSNLIYQKVDNLSEVSLSK